ncbi:unnamed protein product [Adineta steineri]|uniref:Ig-like domain-containing protein n=1 Tax=Adineta steineri TaxID=433720 RepID=A0A813NGS0_9BILA|nr:unnamed protein product [Adineta steineri]CAF3729273.1 unnamed protein product [Adineta steineri]
MLSKNLLTRIIILFIINGIKESSSSLCSEKGTNNGTLRRLISFDSGNDLYSARRAFDFGFTTVYEHVTSNPISSGKYGIVNEVPYYPSESRPFPSIWHIGTDHTGKSVGGRRNGGGWGSWVDWVGWGDWEDGKNEKGYMLIINVENGDNSILFSSTINGLSIGSFYEFSAYFANVVKGNQRNIPNVRFEVKTATDSKDSLPCAITGPIQKKLDMDWTQYGLLFKASSESAVLLMISETSGGSGNTIAIDDIELRVCSTTHSDVCSTG